MKNIFIKKNNIYFEVNYYTELLGDIGILSDDQDKICDAGTIRCNKTYYEDVLEYFKDFNGYSNIDYGKVAINGLIGMASGAVTGAVFAGIGRGIGLLGKTKWAQRNLENYDDVSKNYMFGSKGGNFTFLRNGNTFRLEASIQHGLHYHSLAAGTTAEQWK